MNNRLLLVRYSARTSPLLFNFSALNVPAKPLKELLWNLKIPYTRSYVKSNSVLILTRFSKAQTGRSL